MKIKNVAVHVLVLSLGSQLTKIKKKQDYLKYCDLAP